MSSVYWIGVEGIQYDLTGFDHPGGTSLLNEFANRDATVHFLAMHHRKLLRRLSIVGTYKTSPTSALQTQWMELHDKFEREGRYKPVVWFLYTRIGILVCLAMAIFYFQE